jgi:RNA polymerase sigma-70 factor (ECF subfamily)
VESGTPWCSGSMRLERGATISENSLAVRTWPVTDAELVRMAQAGDRDAFGSLVERHAPMVRRLTRAVLGQEEDAEDAAQDAFLSAWTAFDRFDARVSLGPWLARIALNAARDLRRRRRVRSTEPIPESHASASLLPDHDTERALLRERLVRALRELPERQRVAVVLFEVEGYSHAEVGAMLGIPEGTARSDVFHARRKLRLMLGPPEPTGA